LTILDEIKDSFANLQKGQSRYLSSCDARTFMFEDGTFGVGIEFERDLKVSENFANVKFYSLELEFDKDTSKFLVLTSSLIGLRNEFATVCADFVDLGENNANRESILEDPFIWWMRWRELLGNAVKSPKVHSILGEMYSVKYLLLQGKEVKWTPTDFSTHDIETSSKAFEVKSTTSKYEQVISVNSQFQMATQSDEELDLFICRFEKSNLGISINQLIEELSQLGLDKDRLNREINAVGFEEGSLSRNETYKLLEMRRYHVDEDFPGKELMKYIRSMDDPSVKSIQFEVDLTNTPYVKCDLENLDVK